MKAVPIANVSEEFSRLEYFLQLTYKANTLKLDKAFPISNPQQQHLFEKKSQGSVTLECLIEPKKLTDSEHEDILVQKLTQSDSSFPNPKGLLIEVGHRQHETKQKKLQMVYCRVMTGKSFLVESQTEAENQTLPDGFDSFHLMPSGQNDYKHEYLIKNPQQLLPLYLLQFEYDPEIEKKSRQKPICDNCSQNYAAVYCSADVANLCSDCDHKLHSASKIAQKHQRTPLGKSGSGFGNCKSHPGQMIEFFCSQCHIPVCIHCKMVGHHSTGEATQHRLVSVVEALETVLENSKKKDAILEQKMSTASHKQEQYQKLQTQLQKHHEKTKSELYSRYQRALLQLNAHTEFHMKKYMSMELEHQRQKQEIQYLNTFWTYQTFEGDERLNGLNGAQVVENWNRHEQRKQELRQLPMTNEQADPVQFQIKGDLMIDLQQDYQNNNNNTAKVIEQEEVPKVPKKQVAQSPKKTLDLFSETLQALDDWSMERSSYRNALDMDERQYMSSSASKREY